jgi:hypothetical protein
MIASLSGVVGLVASDEICKKHLDMHYYRPKIECFHSSCLTCMSFGRKGSPKMRYALKFCEDASEFDVYCEKHYKMVTGLEKILVAAAVTAAAATAAGAVVGAPTPAISYAAVVEGSSAAAMPAVEEGVSSAGAASSQEVELEPLMVLQERIVRDTVGPSADMLLQ